METLGKRISENRKAKNIKQEELAEMLLVSPQAVSKWENNISCPDISLLPKLAEILGVSVDELLQASTSSKEENGESKLTVDLVLKAIPLALSIGVTVLTAIDQIYWEDAVSLLGLAVLVIAVRNFREK